MHKFLEWLLQFVNQNKLQDVKFLLNWYSLVIYDLT